MNVGEFHLISHWQFSIRKGGIFRPGKEIEGLRGGVPMYAAQEAPKIDTARAEKDSFRMETSTTPTFMTDSSRDAEELILLSDV
jgi:hypothetical protein